MNYSVGYTILHTPQGNAVAVWYPTDAKTSTSSYLLGENVVTTEIKWNAKCARGKFPLVLYSHGASGCGLSMAFCTERLASQGFIVAAPDYTDAYYAARIDRGVEQTPELQRDLAAWFTELHDYQLNTGGVAYRHEHLMYRPQQASEAIRLMINENSRHDSLFRLHIDIGKVGAFGHSFGAWTSILIAGADEDAFVPVIDCVAALSGPCNGAVYEPQELGQIEVPVLFMYGANEPLAGRLSDRTYLYDRANAPKTLIGIAHAGHFTFSGGVQDVVGFKSVADYYADPPRRVICDYVEAFLKYRLKGGPKLVRPAVGVTEWVEQ